MLTLALRTQPGVRGLRGHGKPNPRRSGKDGTERVERLLGGSPGWKSSGCLPFNNSSFIFKHWFCVIFCVFIHNRKGKNKSILPAGQRTPQRQTCPELGPGAPLTFRGPGSGPRPSVAHEALQLGAHSASLRGGPQPPGMQRNTVPHPPTGLGAQ